MKTLFVVLLMWHYSYAPPVTKNEPTSPPETDPLDFIHYNRYLKEVVSALEADPTFREKLEKASEDEIKSGKIANELHFVEKHIRDKLTELKRYELQRLLDFKHKLINEQGLEHNEVEDALHRHLDPSNKHTFEIQDLKKLISQTTQDLAEADRRRREEFKQYELEKEYEKQEKLNQTNGVDERDKLEKRYKDLEEKHKKHQPLHQPGHKAQLEEVWEKQDHMQQKFDPVAFFKMHDTNSDGLWDQIEVSALFVKELNKLYEAGAPEDDLRERAEEMERMREAVFKEMDTDHDNFISEKEFLLQTRQSEFQQDRGWKGLDEQRPFTDEEYEQYIRQHHQRMPPPGYYPPPQGYQQGYHQPQAPPQGQHQAPPHPGQYQPPVQQSGQYQPPPQPGQYQPPLGHQPPPHPAQYQQPPAQYQQQPPQYQAPNQPQGYQQHAAPVQDHQPPPQVNQVYVQNPHEAGKPIQAP